ncbi:MAG TPA: metallophosphatase family protein [Epsilonproteobacteria bacterium]|nr:metallophosphatase family protein [Campylobacterota bacterium]
MNNQSKLKVEKMSHKIFVCGDTHGLPYDTEKLNSRNFLEQKNLTKDDVVIQLGDFGWVWHPIGTNKEQEYWLDWLAGKKYTLAVVLGNHENYTIIETLPTTMKWNNEVKVLERKNGSIYFLKRGAIYSINNKEILTIGGAISTDKSQRAIDISWWAQEELSSTEREACLNEISLSNKVFDYVLTHTCPSRLVENFSKDPLRVQDSVAQFLDHVDEQIEFKQWHFGHFHKDKSIHNEKYRCHYNNAPFELI